MKLSNKYLLFFCIIFFPSVLTAEWEGNDPYLNLLNDLLVVESINKKINDRMPVTYDNFLQGGYFNMPSARMGAEGEVGGGYSSVHPYRNYNLRVQLIHNLEISGNYRIFRGIDDPILSPLGFGDMSDKGANVKLAFFHPEDSGYALPGLAIGFQDFMGTKNFNSRYIVLTHVFIDHNLEISLGYGSGRIKRWFGGLLWMPFRQSDYRFLKSFTLGAEYDATPYSDPNVEKHPGGRESKSKINFGVKYRLWDSIELSLSYVRGQKLAYSISSYYNFGKTKGFLPKIEDPLPYRAPVNTEPLGYRRPEDVLVQDLLYPFRRQGFEILEVLLSYDEDLQKILRIKILNVNYRLPGEVRNRLNYLLAYLIPEDIEFVIVAIEAEDGLPVLEYHYKMEYVRRYGVGRIGQQELDTLSPICPITFPEPYQKPLYKKRRELFNFEILPKTHTFFGSSKGKFKYSLGLSLGFNGFFGDDIYYSILLGYNFLSDLNHLTGIDRLNPSQLINVRTDIVKYYQQRGITLDEGYLQKNWNMGNGWFSRLAFGYFEEEYGGIATEFLYYPLYCPWAIGFEGAVLKKRSYHGLGFTSKIRKLHGFHVTHRKFLGTQGFVDFYYDWRDMKVDFKVMVGKFLANDVGARFEMSRRFDSGLRITFWYTRTNGHDRINGETYHDKGVAFSMPLDIFYTHSDRDIWNYGLSAWLRDVGVTSETGNHLYNMINDERE